MPAKLSRASNASKSVKTVGWACSSNATAALVKLLAKSASLEGSCDAVRGWIRRCRDGAGFLNDNEEDKDTALPFC